MATVTDIDLQQLKDLITTLHTTTQKQITDGNAAIQKQIADADKRVEVGLAKVEAELKGIQTQITDIKTDQRAQDGRFFALIFIVISTAVGISVKLAKLY